MAYNQPAGQGTVQIIKRPMTDQEQANALSYYGVMQKAVRALAAVCFILLIFNLGVLLGGFPVPELEIVFAILGLVLGLAALGLSAAMMGLRRKVTAALADGTVIEVRAPAFQNRTMGSKANSWNVGPLSIMTSPELQPLLVEGAQASVVCIPGIKVALSVNGTAFKRPPMLSAPPNLAAMATAQAAGPAPLLQSMQGPSYPQQAQQPYLQQPYPQQAQQPYPQQPQQPYPQQPYPQQAQQPYPQQPLPQQPQEPYPQQPLQQPQPYLQPQPYPSQPQPYPQQPAPPAQLAFGQPPAGQK